MRIGTGFDVHKFGDSNVQSIRLGGVDIPYHREILAHSDGDVILHALCDAMLGALALGDIGHHFPDTDASFANVDSRELMRHVSQLVAEHGFRIGNADITVIAQAPRVADYLLQMRESIAADTNTSIQQISVKATTTEKLGFIGRAEGIAAEAVVLLEVAGG
ncbi:MAG: 2-C-methyl-D-erythritol 2,4-cyclodiphosphate synthase [Candidatus Azotimanducaceae bacterium]